MPLLRPGVCVDAVAGRNICNIRKIIADWERRTGGPVVRDQLVNSWLKKFQFGWGRKLLPWDEEVSSELDKLDNLFSLKINKSTKRIIICCCRTWPTFGIILRWTWPRQSVWN